MNVNAGNKISRRLLVQWRMEPILSGQKQLTEIILWTGVSVSYKCYRHLMIIIIHFALHTTALFNSLKHIATLPCDF